MAARTILEEKIRLYVESAGDEEIKRLVSQFGDLGDEADFQSNIARKAMERLADTIDDIAKVEAFDKLKRELQQTEDNLKRAQLGAQALFREFNTGDQSNSAVTRLQKQASKSVNELSDAAERQRRQLQQLRGELSASGIDTRKLGTAQGELKQRLADARGGLATAAKSVQQFRSESARAAREVPAANERIAKSYEGIGGAVTRLRSIIAPVLAFLTFRSAAQGVKALAEVQQQAEDARRALSELYGSQEEGNRAYARLETLSKRNGLALGDVVEQAKRLKAFGIDPLNGSLQALVDQNAASGGSMEDLAGKVLALGQAWAKQKLQGEEILQLVERGVPVWDLLQKATGKNVQELQKLSQQGKLGRDVIQALYEEIGRANSGAANRALGSLTGLLAQASARWREFQQEIVEAGLGDYLKQQLSGVLQATGGLEGLARRVSASIISTIEALKRFGQQLAPVAKAIGETTLALGRNAEAVLFLGKVYAVIKLSQLATGFSALARAQDASAGAAQRAAAALFEEQKAVGGLRGLFRALPKSVQIGIAVLGVDFAITQVQNLIAVLKDREAAANAAEAAERSQRELQQEQLLLGRQLQATYQSYAGTVIKSAEDISRLTREQGVEYQFALEQARQYYAGVIREARAAGDAQAEAAAVEKFKALGDTLDEVKRKITDLGAPAAAEGRIGALADAAVGKFDELIGKGKSAKEAISGLFDGIDLTRTAGVQQASDILQQLEAGGKDASKAVRDELSAALEQVSSADLPKVEAAAVAAFGAGSAAAKQMAEAVDQTRFARLGVDLEAIKTGFSAAGREVTTAFRDMVNEIDDLGLTAEQKSQAIAQAFDNAFKQASTKSELESLKKSLIDALNAGDIGFVEFQQRIAETDAKLAGLGKTGEQIGQSVEKGAQQASQALDQVAASADEVAVNTSAAADKIDEASEFMGDASKEGQKFALANYAVSDSAAAAYTALNRYAGQADIWRRKINSLTREINAQGHALEEEIARIAEANAEFDELAGLRKQLQDKYSNIAPAEVERLVQAQAQLQANQQRAAEQRQQQLAAELRATQQVVSARERTGSGGSREGFSGVNRSLGTIRIEVGDKSADIPTTAQGAEDLAELLRQLARAQSVSLGVGG